MSNKNKDPFSAGIQKTKELLFNIQKSNVGADGTENSCVISDESRSVNITVEQAKKADECVAMLRKGLSDPDGWTQKDIETVFRCTILDAMVETSTPHRKRLDDSVATLKEELSKPLGIWEVHQPIRGLSPQNLPTNFGNVRFYWGDEKTCRAMKGAVKVFKGYLEKQIAEDVEGKSFCRVVVAARSSEAAFGKALRELSLTIDVMNLFANVNTRTGGRLYLPGEAEITGGFSMMLQMESGVVKQSHGISQNSSEWGTSSYLAGPFSTFSLSKEMIAARKSCGWERASRILATEKRNKMEDRILAAMRWAGRATATKFKDEDKQQTYLVADQAFLLYAIALETLLLNRGSELSYRLGLRGAHLLARTTAERGEVQKELFRLYDLRSEIVHDGKSSVSLDELRLLQQHAKSALFIVLTRRPFSTMKNEDEFHEWFDSRLLR